MILSAFFSYKIQPVLESIKIADPLFTSNCAGVTGYGNGLINACGYNSLQSLEKSCFCVSDKKLV